MEVQHLCKPLNTRTRKLVAEQIFTLSDLVTAAVKSAGMLDWMSKRGHFCLKLSEPFKHGTRALRRADDGLGPLIPRPL